MRDEPMAGADLRATGGRRIGRFTNGRFRAIWVGHYALGNGNHEVTKAIRSSFQHKPSCGGGGAAFHTGGRCADSGQQTCGGLDICPVHDIDRRHHKVGSGVDGITLGARGGRLHVIPGCRESWLASNTATPPITAAVNQTGRPDRVPAGLFPLILMGPSQTRGQSQALMSQCLYS